MSSKKTEKNTEKRTFSTPMMQQYAALKETYDDYLLLYRLGDFYELFLDDAEVAARELQIVLTRRPRGKDGDIPMAGVPYHAVDRYIGKLVEAGHKIAICEQVSQPDGKGIVERDVVRIVTPGTVLDEQSLKQKEHNYLMCLSFGSQKLGIAVADLSTGSFQVTELQSQDIMNDLKHELVRFCPAEILLNEETYNDPDLLAAIKQSIDTNVTRVSDWNSYVYKAEAALKKEFNVSSLKGFGIHDDQKAIEASAVLLAYLKDTQKTSIKHVQTIQRYEPHDSLILDPSTISNLELFHTLHEGRKDGSLISILDQTQTPMGGRLLREWIRRPLKNPDKINKRLDVVDYFLRHKGVRDDVREYLSHMYDIERLLSRVSLKIGNAADLVNISSSLKSAVDIRSTLMNEHADIFKALLKEWDDDVLKAIEMIDSYIVDEPPIDVRGGGLIKEGVHTQLDDLRKQMKGGKEWLTELEKREKERTGITTLKVRYNKVFGYYIEISKSFHDKVPDDYIRKQTLVNAERYVTEELKECEEKVLSASEDCNNLEHDIFMYVVSRVTAYTTAIQKASQTVATIDCLASFAENASKHYYTRPTLSQSGSLNIHNGRHPVVEQLLDRNTYVPNSVHLQQGENQVHIITGPNMAGKSVYIRQTAIIVLMAHIGSFVPAQSADVCMTDRIFVRSGASDMITSGLSTFMVEMVETAYILNHATAQSLIILDEIGRGTSTYDGISIAWAVAEHLVTHWKKGPKTLFATHYHELQELEEKFPERMLNYHMAVEDHKGTPIFLYRVVPGAASHSYGVAVAKLAGVPDSVIASAEKMLHSFEKGSRATHENDQSTD